MGAFISTGAGRGPIEALDGGGAAAESAAARLVDAGGAVVED
jgi:hypothetical protein